MNAPAPGYCSLKETKGPPSVMNDHGIAPRKLPSEVQVLARLTMEDQQLAIYTTLVEVQWPSG